MRHDQPGRQVAIFSNTFWSIYNFRRSLIKVLIEHGYAVTAISAPDKYQQKLEELGCKTVVLRNFDAKSTGPVQEMKLLAEIVRVMRRIDARNIFTFTIKPNLYTAITQRLTGKKTIITVNGLGHVFSHQGGGTVAGISLRLFQRAFRASKGIVFQNPDDHRFFADRIRIDNRKVRFVRGSGVNLKELQPPVKEVTADKPLVFLMACRLLREKGIYEFIEAATEIIKQYPGTQFKLLGMEAKNPSAVSKAELRQYEEQGIISLLNPTDNIGALLDTVDVLTLPSYYNEGVPRILLEGLAKGLPIITTDNVGCRETVQDGVNGYLVTPRDAGALRQSMEALINLSPAARAAMGTASRALAESDFDEQKVIETYIALLEEKA